MGTTYRQINTYHIQQVAGNSNLLLATLQCTEITLPTSDSPVTLIAIGANIKEHLNSKTMTGGKDQRTKC